MKLDYKTDALIIIDLQNDFTFNNYWYNGSLAVQDGDKIIAPILNVCTKFQNIYFTQDHHIASHISFASSHKGRQPFDVIEMYGHTQVLWPDHCVVGTYGAEIVPQLANVVCRANAIIRKGMNINVDSYSAFRENFGQDGKRATTGFGAMLHARGLKKLFICGLARDYCVKFSAEDAAAEGFEVFILDDLTKSVNASYDSMAEVEADLSAAGVKLLNSKDIE